MSVFNDFWTKTTEISWGFFSKGQKVKIPLHLMSFADFSDFLIKKMTLFFKGQKSEKLSASQQRLAPIPGGGGSYGTIWYHMAPYGTIWYHRIPYGTITVPLGSIMVPYGL